MNNEADKLRAAIADWRRRKTNPAFLGSLSRSALMFADRINEFIPLQQATRNEVKRFFEARSSLSQLEDSYSGKDAAAGEYSPPLSAEKILREHLKYIQDTRQTVCQRIELFVQAARKLVPYLPSAAALQAQLIIGRKCESQYVSIDEKLLLREHEIASSNAQREKADPKSVFASQLNRKIYTSYNQQLALLKIKKTLMERQNMSGLVAAFDAFCAELEGANHYARSLSSQAAIIMPKDRAEADPRSAQTLDVYVDYLLHLL